MDRGRSPGMCSRVIASAGLAAKILRRTGAVPWRITAYDDVPYVLVLSAVFPYYAVLRSTTIELLPLTIYLRQPGPGNGRRLRRRRSVGKAFRAIWPPGVMSTRGSAAAASVRAAPSTTSTSSLPTVPRLKSERVLSCFLRRGTRPPGNSTDSGRRLSVAFVAHLQEHFPDRRAASRRQGNGTKQTRRCPRLAGQDSSRAAGKLGDILVECLRRQLQAFDRRQIGEDRVRNIIDGEAVFDRQCSGLNTVRPLGRKDVCPD